MSQIFSFLIATDCHLGYEETDPVIGEDSFVTFEEILIKAVEEDVDLILLGGDLFHHNNPSQKCMNKCMQLLRHYTFGDRPLYFELLSNVSEVFSNSVFHTTNYLDDNLNVAIPVFSIHGNHDDPSGLGQFSALDTLSSAGLVNYFGKWTNLDEIVIKPILLRKGATKIALYGLSHIKDDRLCRMFIHHQVKFIRPEIETENWFNIFVLHQNRADRGPKRFIAESYIPEFMDLVIWGHEHDCRIELQENLEKGFYLTQPGSSVRTSLSEGEALEKFVAVLKVYKRKMKLKPLKLNTTRPFVWRTEQLWNVNVTTVDREKKSQQIKAHCSRLVEEMIKDAEKLLTGHPKQPKIPLIRLRCDYDDESQLFNIVKFGQVFQGLVANPNGDIVRLKRSFAKKSLKKEKPEDLMRLNELYKDDMEERVNFTTCVNHIVRDYFTNHEEAKMLLLRVNEMEAAVEQFIDKDNVLAIEESVDLRFERVMKELAEQKVNADETDLKELFEQLRNEDEKVDLREEKDLTKKLEKYKSKKSNDDLVGRGVADSDAESGTDAEEDDDPVVFGGEKGNHSMTVVSDSGTDEYEVEEERNRAESTKKKDNSSDSDNCMFVCEGGGSSKTKTAEVSRGRGRGRKRGRGLAKTTEVTRRQSPRGSRSTLRAGKTRQPLKFTNSIIYDDDSD